MTKALKRLADAHRADFLRGFGLDWGARQLVKTSESMKAVILAQAAGSRIYPLSSCCLQQRFALHETAAVVSKSGFYPRGLGAVLTRGGNDNTKISFESETRALSAAVVQISAASLPKPPAAAFPDPPNTPEALPTRQRSKPQQRPYKTHR